MNKFINWVFKIMGISRLSLLSVMTSVIGLGSGAKHFKKAYVKKTPNTQSDYDALSKADLKRKRKRLNNLNHSSKTQIKS